MNAKISKVGTVTVTSRESLQAIVADVVRLKLETVKLKAAMEAEVAALQKRHQAKILQVAADIEAKESGVDVYCRVNRAELFIDKKSIDMLLATIGYEWNPWRVEKTGKKDTWVMIARRLLATKWGKDYVRLPDPEVNKKRVIDDQDKLTPDQLSLAGIRFDREEQFYIRPKSDVAPDTTKSVPSRV